jgi:hypothetical protein
MSGARQTVAIGFIFWAFARWQQASVAYKVLMIFLATSFHTSAIIFLALIAIGSSLRLYNRLLLMVLAVAYLGFTILNSTTFEFYTSAYLPGSTEGAAMEAEGALFHVALNAGPAALALAFWRRVGEILLPDTLHRVLAFAALLMVPVAFLASVAASRFSIYFFPVSMMIMASSPQLFKSPEQRKFVQLTIAAFYVLVLAIWLFFANSALAWQYSNALFVDPSLLVWCCR